MAMEANVSPMRRLFFFCSGVMGFGAWARADRVPALSR
jgi:hypothetical protein